MQNRQLVRANTFAKDIIMFFHIKHCLLTSIVLQMQFSKKCSKGTEKYLGGHFLPQGSGLATTGLPLIFRQALTAICQHGLDQDLTSLEAALNQSCCFPCCCCCYFLLIFQSNNSSSSSTKLRQVGTVGYLQALLGSTQAQTILIEKFLNI